MNQRYQAARIKHFQSIAYGQKLTKEADFIDRAGLKPLLDNCFPSMQTQVLAVSTCLSVCSLRGAHHIVFQLQCHQASVNETS